MCESGITRCSQQLQFVAWELRHRSYVTGVPKYCDRK